MVVLCGQLAVQATVLEFQTLYVMIEIKDSAVLAMRRNQVVYEEFSEEETKQGGRLLVGAIEIQPLNEAA